MERNRNGRRKMRIAVLGSYGVGLTMRVPRAPQAGETVDGGEFSEEHGGKGSNQAVAAARLGADVCFLTAVGDDHYGRAAFELWEREGVDASHVAVQNLPTMVGFITVEPSGENRISISPGALSSITPEFVETFADQIARADTVLVSMEIPEGAVLKALEIGRGSEVRTFLNPAPARYLPDWVWDCIDVLTPNETEAPVLLGLPPGHGLPVATLARMLQARTRAGCVALTRGKDGAVLVNRLAELRSVPSVPAKPVDTTGAGDSYTAALAVGMSEGLPFEVAARIAAAAGAHTVRRAGVVPALPFRGEIREFSALHHSTKRTDP
jgi:ribokinase